MKATRSQLRRIIREQSNQPVDPRKMRDMGYNDALAGKYMDPRYENQIDYKMGFNDGLDDIDDESSATGSMYEGDNKMKITKRQLRRIIKEEKQRLLNEAYPMADAPSREWVAFEKAVEAAAIPMLDAGMELDGVLGAMHDSLDEIFAQYEDEDPYAEEEEAAYKRALTLRGQ